jgi:hypothetical protein
VNCPPGDFHHVAGVVDKAGGTGKIYVDGVLRGTSTWAPGTAAREYGKATWKIGIGMPDASPRRYAADGIIDEVRIYARALPAAEIQELHAAGAKPADRR